MKILLSMIGGAAIATVLVILAFVAIMWMMMIGMSRQEIVDCNEWKSQSVEFPGFYLTKWQKSQCDAHGIEINAEVK